MNDLKTDIVELGTFSLEPGSSGVQMRLKRDMMLEKYRPECIVCFYAVPWKADVLPRKRSP